MWKVALAFNLVVIGYFWPEFTGFYGGNNFNSEMATAWFVHDSMLPLVTAVLNTIAIMTLIKWFPKKDT